MCPVQHNRHTTESKTVAPLGDGTGFEAMVVMSLTPGKMSETPGYIPKHLAYEAGGVGTDKDGKVPLDEIPNVRDVVDVTPPGLAGGFKRVNPLCNE